MNSSRTLGKLDKLGTCLSLGCAIHCIAMPFLLTVLPVLGLGFFTHSSIDVVMFVITLTLASASLCWGTRVHGCRKPLLFVVAAFIFFLLGGFHNHTMEDAIFIALGGTSLALGHLLNIRLCRSCQHCQTNTVS